MANQGGISRRELFASAGAAGVAFATAGTAIAQSQTSGSQRELRCQIPIELLHALGDVQTYADVVFIEAATSESPEFEPAESAVRGRLEGPLSQARKFELCLTVRHDQLGLTTMLMNYEIDPTSIGSAVGPPPDQIVVRDAQNCWEVVLSIILETFGIESRVRQQFWQVLKERRLESIAEQIGRAAARKDWSRTTLLLRKFLATLFDRRTLVTLEQILGREVFGKILRTFASRFVPWLGWAVMAGSFLVSLSRNLDALKRCH